jgi:hypothetical protein
MALVDDDEVERLDGHLGIVEHRHRLFDQRRGRLEQRGFLVFLLELLFALEDGIEPLDRRDADFGCRIDGVALETLNRVFLGKLVVIGRQFGPSLRQWLDRPLRLLLRSAFTVTP